MVFARGVRKSFGPLEVLKGIDIEVPLGSVACIIGPSGSGKSTFLRRVNHLEKLSAGVLLVDGDFAGCDLRGNRVHEVSNRGLLRKSSARDSLEGVGIGGDRCWVGREASNTSSSSAACAI
jgi:polar amino acid transport system ATP-binding protein